MIGRYYIDESDNGNFCGVLHSAFEKILVNRVDEVFSWIESKIG